MSENVPLCPFVRFTPIGPLVKNPAMTDRERFKAICTAIWGKKNWRAQAARTLGIMPDTLDTWLGEKATLSGPWYDRKRRIGPPPPPEAICDLIKVARRRIAEMQATIEIIRLQPWIDG